MAQCALLRDAFLLVGLQKHAGDEIRCRRAPAKLVLLNNGLLAGTRSAPAPDPLQQPADLRGLAEAAAKFPEFKPIVLCDPGRESTAAAAGFRVQP